MISQRRTARSAALRNVENWARLVLALAHNDIDNDMTLQGVQCFVLVDSDIAHTFADPSTTTYFSTLLPEGGEDKASALRQYMAATIFGGSATSDQYGIAPEHFLEVLNRALDTHGSSVRALREVATNLSAVDIKFVQDWLRTGKNDETLTSTRHGVVRTLERLLGNTSAIGAIERGSRLAKWCRDFSSWVVPTDIEVAKRQAVANSGATPVLRRPLTWPRLDTPPERRLVEFWYRRLRAENSSGDGSRNDLADAKVLACLCVLNFDWRQQRRRIHLYTGSPRLHRAAMGLTLEPIAGDRVLMPRTDSHWLLARSDLTKGDDCALDFLRCPYDVLAQKDLWVPARQGDRESASLRDIILSFPDADRYLAPAKWTKIRLLQVHSFCPPTLVSAQQKRREAAARPPRYLSKTVQGRFIWQLVGVLEM